VPVGLPVMAAPSEQFGRPRGVVTRTRATKGPTAVRLLPDNELITEKIRTMGRSQRIALGVSAGVAGGVGGAVAAFAGATDLPPVAAGLVAALLGASLGVIAILMTRRVTGE
jgi:hypothetical protein